MGGGVGSSIGVIFPSASQFLENLADFVAEGVEGIRHDRARVAQRGVLRVGGLRRAAGLRARVPELHARGEHFGAGARHPNHERFGDPPVFERVHDGVFFGSAQLAQADEHLDGGVGLVAQEMVEQARAGVGVTADGDALVDAVGVARHDVEGLVGEAAALADVADAAGAVQFGVDDVIRWPAGIADFERARRQPADRRRADDDLAQFARLCRHDTRLAFRHALGDDGDGANIRQRQRLHGRGKRRTEAGEVDHDISLRVRGSSLGERGVDGDHHLAAAEERAMEAGFSRRVDDGGDGRRRSAAEMIEVQHTLDSSRLHPKDDGCRRTIKE